MLTLTKDEERFISAYREIKKKRNGYMSESDIRDWIEKYWGNIVNFRRAWYLIENEDLPEARECCMGCRFIEMGSMYPCNSCCRGRKDMFMSVNDENIKKNFDIF